MRRAYPTGFFRNREHYRLLRSEIIPRLADSLSQQPINIWCAGCATGEEAYSSAILLHRHLPPDRDFNIIASDSRYAALHRAKKAVYSADRVMRDIHEYCQPYGNEKLKKIDQDIRSRVSFFLHDLRHTFYVADLADKEFDLILCRNVLCYLDLKDQKRIVSRISDKLKPDGILLIGGSESLFGLDISLQRHFYHGFCYYRR